MSFSNSLGGGSGYKPSGGSTGANQGSKKIAGYNLTTLPTMSAETKQLYDYLLSNFPKEGLAKGLGLTGRVAGGDQGAFDELEAPAYSAFDRFSGQTASRFSGEGMGARNSSGFQNAIAQGQSDLSQGLASQRMGLQRQALQDLRGFSQDLFGTQTQENVLSKKPSSFWDYLLQGAGMGIGNIPGMFNFNYGS